MKELNVQPGDIIATNFGIYQHWSLVTDRFCDYGNFMLISATKRNGTVQEEPWDIVTDGKESYVVESDINSSVSEMLTKARSQIGKWSYSVTERNCEHFVKWSTGLEVESTQVKAGVVGVAAGVSLVGLLSEKPTLLKFLTTTLVVAGIAIIASKAKQKT